MVVNTEIQWLLGIAVKVMQICPILEQNLDHFLFSLLDQIDILFAGQNGFSGTESAARIMQSSAPFFIL
jgi:hypothetical protein